MQNVDAKASESVAAPVETIAKQVRDQPAVSADETGYPHRAKKAWLWVATRPIATLFRKPDRSPDCAANRQPPPQGSALMALGSGIEWTEATWNPVTGCSKISPGCKHCYAERMSERLAAMGQPNYRNGFQLTLQPHMLDLPLRWKKPKTIFVNSMSDLFHQDVPVDYIVKVFEVMNRADWHRYQVLTKRAERLLELDPLLPWTPNILMGVSVESIEYSSRITLLRRTRAHTKFLSLEPLLGPLPGLALNGIDWAIVGGESGPGARLMDPAWVLDIRDQCVDGSVAFFFKQWGGVNKKKTGRLLDGRTWDELPATQRAAPELARV